MNEHRRERKIVGVKYDQVSALEIIKMSRKEGRRVNQKKVLYLYNINSSSMLRILEKIKILAPKMMITE